MSFINTAVLLWHEQPALLPSKGGYNRKRAARVTATMAWMILRCVMIFLLPLPKNDTDSKLTSELLHMKQTKPRYFWLCALPTGGAEVESRAAAILLKQMHLYLHYRRLENDAHNVLAKVRTGSWPGSNRIGGDTNIGSLSTG